MDEFYIESFKPIIQNVGRYAGIPMLEIKFASSDDVDSKMSIRDVIGQIDEHGFMNVLFTGEEPCRQYEAIEELCLYYSFKLNSKTLRFHLNSTANTIDTGDMLRQLSRRFYYMLFFPTTVEKAMFLHSFLVARWFEFINRSDIAAMLSAYDEDQRQLLDYVTMVIPAMKVVVEDPVELDDIKKFCIEKKLRMSVII